LDSEALTLRPIEYRLLALLVKHAGEVVPRAIIFKQIWGDAPDIPRRGADPHIRGLRKKLGVYGDQYIETAITVSGHSMTSRIKGLRRQMLSTEEHCFKWPACQ
jgi:DNA-binding response OmpR family regulator